MLLTETVCIREAARRSPRRSPTGLPSRRSEGLELAREQGKAAREQTVNRTSKNYNLHEKKEKKKKVVVATTKVQEENPSKRHIFFIGFHCVAY